MRPGKKTFFRAIVVCSVSLLVVLCFPAFAETSQRQEFVILKNTGRLPHSSYDEIELKYYNEQNLSTSIGIPAGVPVIWQSAIRLTQMEMAPYRNWTITKINVAFYGESACESIDVRIYIYDNGTPTNPGPLIVNDTTSTLDTTGVTTVPLQTSVDLSNHDELWVAVEWYQQSQPGQYYAWMDCLTGPHIENKSDFVNLGSWQQLHDQLPGVDGRWGIGAIIESSNPTELSIGNIKGPIGIKADVQNVGENKATDIQWSITVTGGLFHKVTVLETGTLSGIDIGSSVEIDTGLFVGFGKIDTIVTAQAANTVEVIVTKTAFVLGPFVVGIR